MKKAFLVIDSQPGFSGLLKNIVQRELNGVQVDTYDPMELGWPHDVDWKHYSIVFLASRLGDDDGLEWLHNLRQNPDFPACIVLGSSNERENLDVEAKNHGAVAYLHKTRLSREAILDALRSAVRAIKQQKAAPAPPRPVPTEQTVNANTDAGDSRQISQIVDEAPPSRASLQPSHTLHLDGYDIRKKIAEGGMASIYYCIREEDGKPAVLKTLTPKAEKIAKLRAVERSDLEYEVISRIHHPHVVRLYDHGRVNGRLYTTMEHFATGDLKERMEKGITQQQALSYMIQIAEGLNAIHGCGIIHRDLKPANIMFREDETLAILDFGIAKDITRKMNLTAPGLRLGTPIYMSPEQGNGGYHLDARSDLYSLGVMLYEMLTKKRPYTGRASDVIRSHLYDPIPQLPGEFYEVQVLIDRLMGKFPHERFESAYDLTQYIRANYRFDTTLNFDFTEEGDFLSLEKDKTAHF